MSDSLPPHGYSMPGSPVLRCLLEFAQIYVHWVSDTISSSATLFFYLQSFPALGSFPMNRLFASSRQKYWRFNFSISLSNEHSGWIFFRIDWFDLIIVQGTLKSLPQHHYSRASILRYSAFFIGEGNGSPFQYSCLENPMDRGAWQATVHGVTKSQTWLSD